MHAKTSNLLSVLLDVFIELYKVSYIFLAHLLESTPFASVLWIGLVCMNLPSVRVVAQNA